MRRGGRPRRRGPRQRQRGLDPQSVPYRAGQLRQRRERVSGLRARAPSPADHAPMEFLGLSWSELAASVAPWVTRPSMDRVRWPVAVTETGRWAAHALGVVTPTCKALAAFKNMGGTSVQASCKTRIASRTSCSGGCSTRARTGVWGISESSGCTRGRAKPEAADLARDPIECIGLLEQLLTPPCRRVGWGRGPVPDRPQPRRRQRLRRVRGRAG